MKERILVKVVASSIVEESGRVSTVTARGISPLRRGQTIGDFVSAFMAERQIDTYSIHQRSEDAWATSPIMSLDGSAKTVVTYHFLRFPEGELGFNARDLTAEELERDMRQLKRYING